MKFAVIVFPGSSGASDMYHLIQDGLGEKVDYIRHDQTDLAGYDVLLLPGGSSYGDYLRAGAIARWTPVMNEVIRRAQTGTLIIGVGNGFQVLLEAGLLPGAMKRNEHLKFRCEHTTVEVVNNQTAFTGDYEQGELLSLPIAHGAGNYYCDPKTLAQLEQNDQIVFRYQHNPNGSARDIAGLVNGAGNVLGIMPHPEQAAEKILGSTAGKRLFTSILSAGRGKHVAT